MEGFRVFSPDEWMASGMDATSYAANNLKKTLEGLAQHLFGILVCNYLFPTTAWNQRSCVEYCDYSFGRNIFLNHCSTKFLKISGAVEMRWVDTYFPFTNPSFELEIYFQVCH